MTTIIKTQSFAIPSKFYFSTQLRTLIKNTKHSIESLRSYSEITWSQITCLITFQQQATELLNQVRLHKHVNHYDPQYHNDIFSSEYIKCSTLMYEFNGWIDNQRWLTKKLNKIDTSTLSKVQKYWLEDFIESNEVAANDLTTSISEKITSIRIHLEDLASIYDDNINHAYNTSFLHFTKKELKGVPLLNLQRYEIDGEYKIPLCSEYVDLILRSCDVEVTRKNTLQYYKNVCNHSNDYNNENIVLDIINNKHKESVYLNCTTTAESICSANSFENNDDIIRLISNLHDHVTLMNHNLLQTIHQSIGLPIEPWNARYMLSKYLKKKYGDHSKSISNHFSIESICKCIDWININTNIYLKPCQTSTNPNDVESVHVWNSQVSFYEVYHKEQLLGGIYFDLFARKDKDPSQFYMTTFKTKNILTDSTYNQAVIVCNFNPNNITVQDLLDFMHELGHGFHFLSCNAPIPTRSYELLEWDMVEFSSVLLETIASNDYNFFKYVSSHYKTKKPITSALAKKIVNDIKINKLFDLQFDTKSSLIDIIIHHHSSYFHSYDEIKSIIKKYNTLLPFKSTDIYDNELCTFSHIMTGAYTASFYSYILSDIMVHQFINKHSNIKECLDNSIMHLFAIDTTIPFLYSFENLLNEELTINYLLNHLQIDI